MILGFSTCGGIFDLAKKQEKVKELEAAMEAQEFWDDSSKAQSLIDEANILKAWTIPYYDLKARFENVSSFLSEVNEAEEPKFYAELCLELSLIEKGLEELEIKKMLSGELDPKNCYLSINSGAGGTEACDWAQMLHRMYERYAGRREWKIESIDRVDGDVAGIKNVTIKISGPFAYGYLKAEKGVHRLVRISPFDSNAKRHTSFASVDVIPEIDDDIQVEIKPEEIRIDTFRASGAGGQHVNTTDSAVRITHNPTGIVVTCQSERSQIKNRETCMKFLKAKLYEKEITDRESRIKKISGEKKEIAWGSQIRNYIFQPYTLVKDTRTKYEIGNIEGVMNGDLDGFIHSYLKDFG